MGQQAQWASKMFQCGIDELIRVQVRVRPLSQRERDEHAERSHIFFPVLVLRSR
jgi:hypothetical protein